MIILTYVCIQIENCKCDNKSNGVTFCCAAEIGLLIGCPLGAILNWLVVADEHGALRECRLCCLVKFV
jgi:hypothetical protein